ncbi:hypothetical protein [Archangium lansingense]|uniref:Type VI lipoprotein IgE-like C-terminal domain-containing protein n=1 Tax=Archangium lansingense TaxID=2995310 RepID=A0ABT4A1G8_9BACT|nr:hypothetical protein [Archangium lansinium]MCY1075139.1 hypothetical protein [Archangium lansinium]
MSTLLRSLAALATLVLGGCLPGHLSLSVKSPAGSNEGRPLYMLVRKVDAKQYASETYSEVAARVVDPDESVLQREVIYPGTLQNIRVKLPPESPVAVYFLFTTPDGPSWQVLLEPPVKSSLDIELEGNRIRAEVTSGPAIGAEPKPPELKPPELPAAGEKK